MDMQHLKIRIRLKAYDHKLLDQSASEIVDTAWRTGRKGCRPIPLPTKITNIASCGLLTLTRSRGAVRDTVHKRLLDILEPTQQTLTR